MKTKNFPTFSEARIIYFAGEEAPSYSVQLHEKSQEWVKQRLNELEQDIFSDLKLTLDETKSLLELAKDKDWSKEGHTGYVAALQVALKHIHETKNAHCDPGKLDAIMLKGKGMGVTKGALKNFQQWYNQTYSKNIKIDGEPGPESIGAILEVLGSEVIVTAPTPVAIPPSAIPTENASLTEPQQDVVPPVVEPETVIPQETKPPELRDSVEPEIEPRLNHETQSEKIPEKLKNLAEAGSIADFKKEYGIFAKDKTNNPEFISTLKENAPKIKSLNDSNFPSIKKEIITSLIPFAS